MLSVHYRQAASADIPQLAALLKLLFSIEQDFRFNREKQQRGLEMLLRSPTSAVYIAETDMKVSGMVTGQLVISTAEGEYSLLIEDLIVKHDLRGLGIGSSLLDRIGEWAYSKGAQRMQLLADKKNSSGLKFYRKEMWQKTNLICLRKYLQKAAS